MSVQVYNDPRGNPDTICTRTTYRDHRGAPCLLSYTQTTPSSPLPPLCPVPFYVVHPSSTPENFDIEALHGYMAHWTDGLVSEGTWRVEAYILPGASEEECLAHYRAELAFRGTVWHQLSRVSEAYQAGGFRDMFEVDLPSVDYLPGQPQEGVLAQRGLTGLPWPHPADEETFRRPLFRGWFLLYDRETVPAPPEEHPRVEGWLVRFDPLPLLPGHQAPFDPMAYPALRSEVMPLADGDSVAGLVEWLDGARMRTLGQVAADAEDVAEELGWTGW